MLRHAVCVRTRPAEDVVVLIVALAEIARRDGLLALEKPVASLNDPFLRKGFQMAIDGADASTIASVLRAEMESTDLRHTYGVRMLESMGRSAPVFGMIGTVIGLVVMLGQLNDPSRIGPGMAVALLTTLYGLVLANVFFLPLARKLTHRSSEELLGKQVVLEGVLAIQAGDNPRVVERRLRAYLPSGAFGGESVARSAAANSVVRVLGGQTVAEAVERRPVPETVDEPRRVEQSNSEPTALEWINSLVAADLLSPELRTMDGKPVVRGEGGDRPPAQARRSAIEEAA